MSQAGQAVDDGQDQSVTGGQSMMSTESVFRSRIIWLVRLRWAVIGSILLAIGVAHWLPGFVFVADFDIGPLLRALALLVTMNTIFHVVAHRHPEDDGAPQTPVQGERLLPHRGFYKLFLSQICVDYCCVALLIFHYGFLSVNLAFLFLPHILITAVVFEARMVSFLVMSLSLLFIYGMVILRYDELQKVHQAFGHRLISDPALVFAAYCTAVFGFTYYLLRVLIDAIITSRRNILMMHNKLQRMNHEKQMYTLRATHELKAPFAAIQAFAGNILNGYLGEVNPKVRDAVVKIQRRCEILSQMIKEVIQLSNAKNSTDC